MSNHYASVASRFTRFADAGTKRRHGDGERWDGGTNARMGATDPAITIAIAGR
ncbi:MAG TPA: hypothetical protein VHJ58_21260 [Vicinamibacterales bacterium]|nr:hypothetical protein [Vicinamibacterales bacterium]